MGNKLSTNVNEFVYVIWCTFVKHKMRNMVWTKGTSALDGEFQSASEVDFYIDKVSISNIYHRLCVYVYNVVLFCCCAQ